jgi:mRNA interferase RelE/StbE
VYEIHVQDSARRELSSLDKLQARRIVKRIRWLADNIESIPCDALTGSLTGFYKLRVGDYRVLYEVLWSEKVLVIHVIGHRKDLYRR